jgi:hypothetical protein
MIGSLHREKGGAFLEKGAVAREREREKEVDDGLLRF